MKNQKVTLLLRNKYDLLLYEKVLQKEGYTVVKIDDCQTLLATVSQQNIIIVDQMKLENEGGYDIFKQFENNSMPVYIIVKCHPLFNISTDVRKFIQAGINDFLPHIVYPPDLIEACNFAAMSTNHKPCVPLVEKLLQTIERLEQRADEYRIRSEWYEENQLKVACDCAEQLQQNASRRKPKSTAFKHLGRTTDGYHEGDKYICGVCKRYWFRGESHTESEFLYFWELAE